MAAVSTRMPNTDRVLGRKLARDLTAREAESVGGAHGGGGSVYCPSGTLVSEIQLGSPDVCDPVTY